METGLRDPRARTQLFRFINVLPKLSSAEQAADYLQQFLGDPELQLPTALRLMLSYRSPRRPLGILAGTAARRCAPLMAAGFICGSNASEAIEYVLKLRRKRMAFTMDILGEACTSDAVGEEYARRYVELIEALAPAMRMEPRIAQVDVSPAGPLPRVNVSVKLSALVSRFDLLAPERTVAALKDRVRPILRTARRVGAFINFDMEQYRYVDIFTRVFKGLLEEPEFADWPDVGTVVQAYLTDAEELAEDLIDWVCRRGTPITIRLVKGAYWDSETARAIRDRRRIPVWIHKWESDACFERIATRLMHNTDVLQVALASHNVRSLAAAAATAESLGLAPHAYEFQMLAGMGEPLKRAIVDLGYRLRVYCPYGDLVPGMAYLIRRLLENTSNHSFLRQSFVEGRGEQELLRSPEDVGMDGEPAPLPRSFSQNYFDDEEFDMPSFENVPDTDFAVASNRERFAESLESVRGQFGREYGPVIGGEELSTGSWYHSVNPAKPAEIVGLVGKGGAAEANRAVAEAKRAFGAWSGRPIEERAELVKRVGSILEERRFELGAWICLEVGKGWTEADADVSEAVDYCNYYSREMLRIGSRPGLRNVPGEGNMYAYAPRGVVVVISTWNFPLALLTGMVSAGVITGNTVVMKPASPAGVVAAKLMEIIAEARFPLGVVNYCPGPGAVVGEALVAHPDVSMIAFTGSSPVGCHVYEQAAKVRPGQKHLKRVVTSMGAKNAIIVDLDAELDEAVMGVKASAFGYAGQKCTACSRVIVVEEVYGAFIDKLVESVRTLAIGPAEEPHTVISPVIDAEARESIMRYIELGESEARCVLRGDVSSFAGTGGYYVPPVIFADVEPESRLAKEEIFGPVLSVLRAKDFEHALRIANSSRYALTGGVYSRSPRNIERARREFAVGNLYINRQVTHSLVDRQPFGGFRLSGLGARAGGPDYLLEFLEPRTITENTLRLGMSCEATMAETPVFVTH
jgi:RHH-type proline utilization regulon transcriptional repressor/proline dehydrogenase/delta 1-pyrroline-5-carboxylate dehydrogenase